MGIMKSNLIILCLTVLGLSFLLPKSLIGQNQDSENPITVMSYNIRFDNPHDGPSAWPYRKNDVAKMIGPVYQVDIVGLQEVLSHQLDDLTERLPYYGWVGVGRDDGHQKGEYSPILYRKDKFDLIATNTFWLSESPETPGSKSWDTSITRIVTWAKFRERSSGKEFYFFNTHFDHRGVQARVESARLILDRIPEISEGLPFILTGDLNVNESSEAYAFIDRSSLVHDARYVSETEHEGPTASFNNWLEIRRGENSRIDYIFVGDTVRVLNHKISDRKFNERFPSDHLPVISDIILPSVETKR